MYSQFDKAITAVIMGIVQLANMFGFHWGLDEHTVTGIIGVVTPILVYIVPNLPKDISA